MILSKSNLAKKSSVSVSPTSATQSINVVKDGDFSSVFTASNANPTIITFNFSLSDIEYVCIAGSNVATKNRIEIQLYNGAARVGTISQPLGKKEAVTLFFKIVSVRANKIIIKIYGSGSLVLSDVAFGAIYDYKYGMTSGYARPWSVPNVATRTGLSLDKAPIALTYEARSLQCNMQFPIVMMDQYPAFYEFVQFATQNTFYVLEDDDITHSYACFNAEFDMIRTHSDTCKIGVGALKFNAHAKLSGFNL